MIVTDFDRTLTQAFVAGQSTSLISTMVREKLFDDDYIEKAKKSYAIYRPIEVDELLPLEYRTQKMQEWWDYVMAVLIDKKLSKAKLRLAMEKTQQRFRPGVAEFLTKLNSHQVPVIILSAGGLGKESIEYFLEKNNLYLPNIFVFCNEFIWDDQGVATDYKRPLIHVLNKDFQRVKNSPIFEKINQRRNVIALGDGIGDLDMVKNCDYVNLLKVGFLNEEIEKLRSAFNQAFDVVIENDGSFEYLNQVLEKMTK
jgi:5'-nucleotidase